MLFVVVVVVVVSSSVVVVVVVISNVKEAVVVRARSTKAMIPDEYFLHAKSRGKKTVAFFEKKKGRIFS